MSVAAEALHGGAEAVGVEVGVDDEVQVVGAVGPVVAVNERAALELRARDPGEGELGVEGVGVDSGGGEPEVGATLRVVVGLVVVVGESELLRVAVVVLAPDLTNTYEAVRGDERRGGSDIIVLTVVYWFITGVRSTRGTVSERFQTSEGRDSKRTHGFSSVSTAVM